MSSGSQPRAAFGGEFPKADVQRTTVFQWLPTSTIAELVLPAKCGRSSKCPKAVLRAGVSMGKTNCTVPAGYWLVEVEFWAGVGSPAVPFRFPLYRQRFEQRTAS